MKWFGISCPNEIYPTGIFLHIFTPMLQFFKSLKYTEICKSQILLFVKQILVIKFKLYLAHLGHDEK